MQNQHVSTIMQMTRFDTIHFHIEIKFKFSNHFILQGPGGSPPPTVG